MNSGQALSLIEGWGFLRSSPFPRLNRGKGSGRTGLSAHPEELKQEETKGIAHFHLPYPNSFDLTQHRLGEGGTEIIPSPLRGELLRAQCARNGNKKTKGGGIKALSVDTNETVFKLFTFTF